jgi:hypothetical protein
VAQEGITSYNEIEDEWQVFQVIGDCAVGIANYLDMQPGLASAEKMNPTERLQILRFLYDLWKFGQEYGELDGDIDEVITGNVTDEERATVEGWVRADMLPGKNSDYKNKELLEFLATLKESAGGISDEEMLEEYRQAKLYKDYITKLLELQRLDEAFKTAQTELTEQRDQFWFAGELLKSGGVWVDNAFSYIEEKLNQLQTQLQKAKRVDYTLSYDVDRYRQWLGEKYVEYGKTDKALTVQEARFRQAPSVTTYSQVKSAAKMPAQPKDLWDNLRPDLIGQLEKQNSWEGLLKIYLDEGEVDSALATLKQMEQNSNRGGYFGNVVSPQHSLREQAAKLGEAKYPLEAIKIYAGLVDDLIRARGRENYQHAAKLLKTVRKLYKGLKQESQWETYIANLRHTNKGLRAFKEELDKAEL